MPDNKVKRRHFLAAASVGSLCGRRQRESHQTTPFWNTGIREWNGDSAGKRTFGESPAEALQPCPNGAFLRKDLHPG